MNGRVKVNRKMYKMVVRQAMLCGFEEERTEERIGGRAGGGRDEAVGDLFLGATRMERLKNEDIRGQTEMF